tara:strand:+ start:664 stop:825 length:162 start_codon:yes stop_codon:yes gene_type:complete
MISLAYIAERGNGQGMVLHVVIDGEEMTYPIVHGAAWLWFDRISNHLWRKSNE